MRAGTLLSRQFDPYVTHVRWLVWVLVFVGLLVAAAGVYWTDGPPSALANLVYLPIMAAAFLQGKKAGALAGLLAGLLLSPLLPTSTETVAEWAVRAFIYLISGTFAGWISEYLHRQIADQRDLSRRLEQTLEEATRAVVQAIDAKHPHTADHSGKVASYAVQIAMEMGLPDYDIRRIRWAALLHDVGKLGIPEVVLDKPGPLSDEEWVFIKEHPVRSERIVTGVTEFQDIVTVIRGHHEAWNGSGYPDGLRGEAIHPWARILAVADAWDAMTSDRPYRPGLDPREAQLRCLQAREHQFDPRVVDAMM